MHYTDNATDGAVQASRRCLFQTPYILGAYAEDTTTDTPIRQDIGGNGITYKVTPRNLYDNGGASADDVDCDIAMVITADSGARVMLKSATAGDQWYYDSTGDTAALITTSDGTGAGGSGLLVDPDGDEISVETKTGSSKSVTIHTVSLWEPFDIP